MSTTRIRQTIVDSVSTQFLGRNRFKIRSTSNSKCSKEPRSSWLSAKTSNRFVFFGPEEVVQTWHIPPPFSNKAYILSSKNSWPPCLLLPWRHLWTIPKVKNGSTVFQCCCSWLWIGITSWKGFHQHIALYHSMYTSVSNTRPAGRI